MEKIDNECYVSLEVAKLLKQAGFDWKCRKIYYEYDGKWELEDNYKKLQRLLELDYCLLAPTLDVAQRWLREVKEYHTIFSHRTEMFFEEKRYNLNEIKADIVNKYPGGGIYITSTAFYRTYEEVQEAGIKNALEIILEKGK